MAREGEAVVGRNYAGAGKGHAQVRVMKHSRWTLGKRRAFLEALAATSNVSAAARAAGISKVQVYRIRRADPAFRAEWAAALREGYEALELELLDRSRHGVPTPVFYAGKRVAAVRKYNDAVALKLLSAHRTTVEAERTRDRGGGAPPSPMAPSAAAEIRGMLDAMQRRREAAAADEAARVAEQQALWAAPAAEPDEARVGCRTL